jgi:CDP-diacylglycerol--serine O-phosphatidyltransferase
MPPMHVQSREDRREHRRRRLRRHGRRAYIRSAYSLPSLATLGNLICGFGAMYVATLSREMAEQSPDPLTQWFYKYHFFVSAYLIFIAMLFDALDGRLARFTRHTTDFGGQLDSLADAISFGAAPAFLALQVFKTNHFQDVAPVVSRLVWAIGALYVSCAAIRLARFNVSNEHGEQHHFSFLGLPSPGAAGAVAALVLMQQDMYEQALSPSWGRGTTVGELFWNLSHVCVWLLPAVVLGTGLLMVSGVRYPHVVNRYLRGKRSLQRLLLMLVLILAIFVAHRYVLGIGCLAYALSGVLSWAYLRLRQWTGLRRAAPASAGGMAAPNTNGPVHAPTLPDSPRAT